VTPFHQKKLSQATLQEVNGRISDFLMRMRKEFGKNYYDFIDESFRFYTSTTLE
jgi:hypothetical protein